MNISAAPHSCAKGRALCGLLLVAALATGCAVGTVADSNGPSAPGDTLGRPGSIERATLAVRVALDPTDAALAAQAGISLGGILVRLERPASASLPQTVATDGSGVARFPSLLEGVYVVSAERPLTPDERERLPAADREVTVLASARRVTVAPPTASTTIELVAARRGSLVLSEVFFSTRGGAMSAGTSSAQYVEFFNAADSAIYLDGMLIFQTALNLHRMVLDAYVCDTHNAAERLDPEGIWALSIWRFPGTGTTHRVDPGKAVVVAVDATDHRVVDGDLQDLRGAEFEFIGDPADPDNPGAVNMIPLRKGGTSAGHNLTANIIIGVALPIAVDTTQLEATSLVNTSSADGGAFRSWRIPRSAILDLGAFSLTPDRDALVAGENCEPFTNPAFDRSPAPLVSSLVVTAIARRSLGFTEGGVEILQRTRTSERDFEYASPLRRSLRRQ